MPASTVTSASFSLGASPEAVHEFLGMARVNLEHMGVDPDLLGNTEVVIAEVLNNIVEHAYAGAKCQSNSEIHVDLSRRKSGVAVLVRDHGLPMPNLELPRGALPDASADIDDLPEGGFGWYIIRELSRGLRYERSKDMNHLRLLVPQPAAEDAMESGSEELQQSA